MKSSVIALIAAGILPFSELEPNLDLMERIEVSQEEQGQIMKHKDSIEPEEFNDAFLRGDYETIYQQFSDDFQESVSFEEFVRLSESFNEGVEAYRLKSELSITKHLAQYVWVNEAETKGIRIVFDKHDTIQGLNVTPLPSYTETDRQYTENEYVMPIKQEWNVVWGGTNHLINYHYLSPEQRYAYDLVIKKNGSSYHGNPLKNKHYYAFGQEVAAPANGKVIKVVEDVEDNTPGEMNADQPLGNHVVIEHDDGEYSLLAHFKQHSISVEPGDQVEQGDLLGLCGNSGNSSEAHIHFQVMDGPDVFEGQSIRIQFKTGKEPIQGDRVNPFN
ncbi:peptidoglycan DD-metalloendopeptidase family protein [Pseudalkalibacillus decolorationis]|uniref:peptidoglycan DD-metalloendopeptidase family protein n=1 Tax=Pseudalkalibacillus decolorationis TaxID=163879 RepID=UPI0021497B0F|nr:peptidoglycan DD-metalloendopeptidase family protein [Pseudalkalibacillus decolorationis]